MNAGNLDRWPTRGRSKRKKKGEEREERGREYNSGEKEESERKNGEIRGCVTGSIMKSLWAYLKLL